jgi:hypothetical protein
VRSGPLRTTAHQLPKFGLAQVARDAVRNRPAGQPWMSAHPLARASSRTCTHRQAEPASRSARPSPHDSDGQHLEITVRDVFHVKHGTRPTRPAVHRLNRRKCGPASDEGNLRHRTPAAGHPSAAPGRRTRAAICAPLTVSHPQPASNARESPRTGSTLRARRTARLPAQSQPRTEVTGRSRSSASA